jgi:hypothetical protein
LVVVGDAEQPFVKGPVTEATEGQPIARVVIVADRPGYQPRRLPDCRLAQSNDKA